jgi:hypothetical protein
LRRPKLSNRKFGAWKKKKKGLRGTQLLKMKALLLFRISCSVSATTHWTTPEERNPHRVEASDPKKFYHSDLKNFPVSARIYQMSHLVAV